MPEPTKTDPVQDRLQVALRAAAAAGRLTLEHFNRAELGVETKSDGSPVTIADRAAETAIRERIALRFPGDAVVGEEHPDSAGDSGFTWVLDPIDGTYSFVHGVPLYGTLIGIEHEGAMVAGVIHLPALDETVYAAIGAGAWHRIGEGEPVPARVSTTAPLARALVCTTSYDYYRQMGTPEVLDRIHQAAGHTRGWSDCYAAVLLATGRADAIVEPIVHPWDIAAIWPVIAEAGGRCTDWEGVDTIRGGTCVMTNSLLHDEVINLVRTPARSL